MALKSSDLTSDQMASAIREEKRLSGKNAQPYIDKKAPVGKTKAARNKYGNNRCYCEILKRKFDSQWERTVARRLHARQQAGEISELSFQVKVCLLGCIHMKPDFQYVEDGELITHEAKGMETPAYVIQRKLWAVAGPTRYRISYQQKTDVDMRPCPTDDMKKLVLENLIGCGWKGGQIEDILLELIAHMGGAS